MTTSYPSTRLRRLRMSPSTRTLVQETRLQAQDLIYPLFAMDGENTCTPILSLPGQNVYTVDRIGAAAQEAWSLGIKSVLLFARCSQTDLTASQSYNSKAALQKSITAIKAAVPEMTVISDVCLCPYTSHGHCGIVQDHHGQTIIDNDSTLEILAKIAVSHAQAGVNMVAPSANIDGMVQAIRQALDAAGYWEVAILAHSAKFASSFYGPFREALDSSPQFGDRKTYQLNPANRLEALREIELDIQEGADMVMVKPALSYLDIIREARNQTQVPVLGYHVSGEYSMIKAAAERGWLNEGNTFYEAILSIKRAGASMIITYAALDLAKIIRTLS